MRAGAETALARVAQFRPTLSFGLARRPIRRCVEYTLAHDPSSSILRNVISRVEPWSDPRTSYLLKSTHIPSERG